MDDYVQIVCDAFNGYNQSQILQLGKAGDTEFRFEMFPGISQIISKQTSANVDRFTNNMNDMYIWKINKEEQPVKIQTSYTKLLDRNNHLKRVCKK